MNFYEYLDKLEESYRENPEQKPHFWVNSLNIDKENEPPFMNKLYMAAYALEMSGYFHRANYYDTGLLKDWKLVVTSAKGEPLTYKVVYEDDPEYKDAKFILPV